MKSLGILSSAVVATGLSLSQPVPAQPAPAALGKVHFETSCTPDASAAFDRAILYQHSLWYTASQPSFEAALKADPTCVVPFRRLTLTPLSIPHPPPPPRLSPI